MVNKQSKTLRLLDLYQRLKKGKIIRKDEEAQRNGIDLRSVQRDIDDVRAFLDECNMRDGTSQQIIYDRANKGFRLIDDYSDCMTNGEILAVSKILLNSRAFKKEEMDRLLDKIVSGCASKASSQMISDLIANEKHNYIELSRPANVEDIVWDIGDSIYHQNLLEISYCRQIDRSNNMVSRIVEPLSLLFSDYYFYLIAHIVEVDDRGKYQHKYEYPAVFRLDRIATHQVLPEKFSQEYSDRFQDSAFRKRVQFMYPGKLQKLRLRYSGPCVGSVLDRLPTASIVKTDDNGTIIEAEVFGKGIVMWVLSQGASIEILSPTELRDEVRQALSNALACYS